MGFNLRIRRLRLDFELGWLYMRVKLSIAPKKKRY